MDNTDTIHEIEVRLPERKVSKFEREKMAFKRLFGDLLKTHSGKYVAIHDGTVVAVADDRLAAANLAYSRVGYVALYIGLVSEEPEQPYRIPHYRIVHTEDR